MDIFSNTCAFFFLFYNEILCAFKRRGKFIITLETLRLSFDRSINYRVYFTLACPYLFCRCFSYQSCDNLLNKHLHHSSQGYENLRLPLMLAD